MFYVISKCEEGQELEVWFLEIPDDHERRLNGQEVSWADLEAFLARLDDRLVLCFSTPTIDRGKDSFRRLGDYILPNELFRATESGESPEVICYATPAHRCVKASEAPAGASILYGLVRGDLSKMTEGIAGALFDSWTDLPEGNYRDLARLFEDAWRRR